MTRVGFIGLGSQGAPMARRIIEAGHPVTLWARRPETLEPFEGTAASVVETRTELGASCDVLCVCVVDTAGIDEVLSGPEGALATLAPGSVLVIHSTVDPATCIRLQTENPSIQVLDAPVSGGGAKAAVGELVVMVGGPSEAYERCRPVFESYADPLVHVGELGRGQAAKLLNNVVFTAQLALAEETFELARQGGLDPSAVATILAASSGRSYAAELVGAGLGLDAIAPTAGPLLAKDVAILAATLDLAGSTLLATADAALDRMRLSRLT